ncbi:MAG TPA: prolyl oligopeptidase family serine peptidase [Planctomycetota bacterium]
MHPFSASRSRVHALSVLLLALLAAPLVAQDSGAGDKPKKNGDKDETALTLENLFPDKGLFGPSAQGAAFSHDGKYAAWLYRPYAERRHGSDLYLHDFATGETRRVTSVSVLEPFQADARKVAEDRIEKAKKAAAKKKKADTTDKGEADAKSDDDKAGAAEKTDEKQDAEKDSDKTLSDLVDEDDAEDEKAPRYGGVSSFEWAPHADEMLFLSDGDIYRLVVGTEGFVRLTKTRERERDVQYLPGGEGYTYLRDGALLRVNFGSHYVDQLDPELPRGQTMSSYRLSRDAQKVVFLASDGEGQGGGDRTVNIATYRDRFMSVREVPRTVSDDVVPKITTSIYLYRLPDPQFENGELVKVFSHLRSGPRDILRVPDWAPDSSKAAFAVYEQETGHVNVLEASFPPAEDAEDGKLAADEKEEDSGDAEQGEQGEKEKDSAKKKPKDGVIDHPAKVIYRFLHNGGPTTPRMIEPQYLADSRRLVFLTELSGFRHLHVLDPVYESLTQLTHGLFEVYPFDMPEHRKFLFATATKEHSSRLDVYKIDLEDGAMTRLTPAEGSYSGPAVSADGAHVLAGFVAYGSLRELVLIDTATGTQTALTDSHPDKARNFTKAVPERFEFENRHGQHIHGHLFKPPGWTKEGKYPLLIYVYGGPLGTSKQVTAGNYGSDAYFFSQYMAEKHGVVAATIDPRGMSGYGALFEKANYEQVGLPQVEDLADGVGHLVKEFGVDAQRVGIHGWSFGGFQTQMCLYTEPDVFQVGIAGAGPTEWENYNSWYSTGTIGPSREGKTDLDKYSLLPLAKNLKGKLLLVHGMEDSNVLYQDTVRVYAELLDAKKETQVELFLDPTGGHGLGGHVKRLARYRKFEEFLLRTLLGPEPLVKADEAAEAAKPGE